MCRRDARVALRNGQQPNLSRRLPPCGHHVADVRVHQRRLDARDENPLVGEDARDAHRAREAKQDARKILIGYRDDVLLIVDDDEPRETFQTMKRALALAHAERSGDRCVRRRALAFAEHARPGLRRLSKRRRAQIHHEARRRPFRVRHGITHLPGATYFTRLNIRARLAVYAEMLIRSSSVSFATTGFIRSAHSPLRAPVCMSNIWRAL